MKIEEVEAIVDKFCQIDYNCFTIETINHIASELKWKVNLWSDGLVECEFEYTEKSWALGYSEDDNNVNLDWFIVVLCTRDSKLEKVKIYYEYYDLIKQYLIKILDKPDFLYYHKSKKNHKQVAWLLTNGILYFYCGEREYDIEVALHIEPHKDKNEITPLPYVR